MKQVLFAGTGAFERLATGHTSGKAVKNKHRALHIVYHDLFPLRWQQCLCNESLFLYRLFVAKCISLFQLFIF
jgi:hypothetical protein